MPMGGGAHLLSALFGMCLGAAVCAALQACDGTTSTINATKLAKQHLDAGRAQSSKGRRADAIGSFRAAINCGERASSPSANSLLGEAYFNLGAELHLGGKLGQAVAAMKQAAKLSPAVAGDAYFQVGYWRSLAGDGEGAVEGFSHAVKADPQNAHAWSNLGVTHQQVGRFQQALEAYRKSAQVNPKYVQNHFNMGKVLQDLGQSTEAIDAFRRAVVIQPTYFEAYASLGGALTPMRRWKEATAILTDALLLEPRSPEALYLLAFAQMHICHWDQLGRVLESLHNSVRERLSSAQSPGVEPYAALTFPWHPSDLRAIAEYHSRLLAETQAVALGHTPQWSHPILRPPSTVLRVALKSYDIGDHQSSYLMSSVLTHLAAPSRRHLLTLNVFCLRPDDSSALRASIEEGVGHEKFFDVSALPTTDIAEKINQMHTHIVVDMDAHFRNSRHIRKSDLYRDFTW